MALKSSETCAILRLKLLTSLVAELPNVSLPPCHHAHILAGVILGYIHFLILRLRESQVRPINIKMGDIKAEIPPEEHPPPSYESTTQAANVRPLRRPALPLNLPLVTNLRNRRVILASASPRRKQLLAQVALNYPNAT